MGGLAGVLFGLHYSLVNPYSGFFPGLKAFTAAVLGGIGNIPGAMLGGMVLGMLEAFAASYLVARHRWRLRRRVQRCLRLRRADPHSDFSPQGLARRKGPGGPRVSRSLAPIGLLAYISGSCLLAYFFPQSVLAFLLVEASLLLLYYIDAPRQVKIFLGALVLVILFHAGWANGYYLEMAIQIGIFVALALGFNIVVGFVGSAQSRLRRFLRHRRLSLGDLRLAAGQRVHPRRRVSAVA